MITERIRLIAYRGRLLWQHDSRMGWEIEPARFIRHLLRSSGFKTQEAARIMRGIEPIVAEPSPIVARIVHRGTTIVYRVATWVGKRYATETQTREWLRSNGFDADEIRSLFAIADTLLISASEAKSVRALAAHGIRP